MDTVRALAKYGQVTPVTVPHRVDEAARRIDGWTVGEITPESRVAHAMAPR